MATVLWIDDETLGFSNRKLLLQKCGHQLLTANNVRSAIDQFVNNPVDLAILDCHMFSMNSHSVTALLRTLRPSLPIVMLSDFCPADCSDAAEVDVCLRKDESAATLLTAIRSLTSSPTRVADQRCA